MRQTSSDGIFDRYSRLRKEAAGKLASNSQLPRGLRKFVGVLLFLMVSSLAVGGGAFMIAAFMHVIVTRLDMPPAVPFPSYDVAQTTQGTSAATRAQNAGTAQGAKSVAAGVRPSSVSDGQVSGGRSGTQQSGNAGVKSALSPKSATAVSAAGLTVMPRPTLQNALDRVIDQNRNPADAYIQSDAVDLGLLLQREVHQWLMGVFADATRAPASPPVEQLGVPLTGGQ